MRRRKSGDIVFRNGVEVPKLQVAEIHLNWSFAEPRSLVPSVVSATLIIEPLNRKKERILLLGPR